MLNFEAIVCLEYKGFFMKCQDYPYGKIRFLELCEWAAL